MVGIKWHLISNFIFKTVKQIYKILKVFIFWIDNTFPLFKIQERQSVYNDSPSHLISSCPVPIPQTTAVCVCVCASRDILCIPNHIYIFFIPFLHKWWLALHIVLHLALFTWYCVSTITRHIFSFIFQHPQLWWGLHSMASYNHHQWAVAVVQSSPLVHAWSRQLQLLEASLTDHWKTTLKEKWFPVYVWNPSNSFF